MIGRPDERPFVKLPGDQPGGPEHAVPVPAEPSESTLLEAATAAGTRLDAETFAIVLSHAIEDQTPDSAGDTYVDHLGAEMPIEAVRSTDLSRRWAGNRVVPGGRSWVRSRWTVTGGRVEAVVQVVDQIEVPLLGDAPGEPFVCWGENLVTVKHESGRWRLIDLQRGVASEKAEFSPWTWRDAMDSGRDWRRVAVS